jgi:hypothetical protein
MQLTVQNPLNNDRADISNVEVLMKLVYVNGETIDRPLLSAGRQC